MEIYQVKNIIREERRVKSEEGTVLLFDRGVFVIKV